MAKNLIALASKSSSGTIKTFYKNAVKTYIESTKVLQNKMPITNRILKAICSIDPKYRQHSLSLNLMKELSDHAKNAISDDEKEVCGLEAQRYHISSFHQLNDGGRYSCLVDGN